MTMADSHQKKKKKKRRKCLPELILSFLPHLTPYHTFQTFNNPKEGGFRKHSRKRRKCWYTAFSPFPTAFCTLSKREIIIKATFHLSSANAFNLVLSENLLFAKDLICMYIFIYSDELQQWH